MLLHLVMSSSSRAVVHTVLQTAMVLMAMTMMEEVTHHTDMLVSLQLSLYVRKRVTKCNAVCKGGVM
jgi:hypothetical protein